MWLPKFETLTKSASVATLYEQIQQCLKIHVKLVRGQELCSTPTVSVVLPTYNHVRYIRQSIDSVLMQLADFPVEIIISDDFSTDGTREVLLEYQLRHPDRIALALSDGNLWNAIPGMPVSPILFAWMSVCRGKYLVILEGDDFWTDDRKLLLQARALDANPHWAGCFHRYTILDDKSQTSGPFPAGKVPGEIGFEQLIFSNFMATASVLVRREWIYFRDSFFRLPMGDWWIFLLLTLKGPIGFLDKSMSVYRAHSDGVWSKKSNAQKIGGMLDLYNALETEGLYKSLDALRTARNSWVAKLVQYAEELESRTR